MIEWRREPFPRLPFEIGNIVTVAGSSHARQASPVRHLLPRCPDVSTVTISVPNPSGDLESHRQCMWRSEEHTSELQSLMRISYAVFCLKKKKIKKRHI